MASSTGRPAMRSSSASASSYRVWIPSRLRTARPPSFPMIPALRVSTTPSIADASSGMSKVCPSSRQERSTSSGSRVRRLGTIAISSSP